MQRSKSLILSRALLGLLALGITGGSSSVAQAFETSPMSGTACHPNRADAGKINYSSTWGIYNDGTSSGTVYCPVVFVPEFTFEAYGLKIWVYDQNSGSGNNVSCTLNGLNQDGTVGHTAGTKTTSGSSSGAMLLGWDPIQPFPWIAYNAICKIPPMQGTAQSRVTTYGPYVVD